MLTFLAISANIQKDGRWRLASQFKCQCIPQLWTFAVPASPFNKNKLNWALDQSQSFNDLSQLCSKHSRSNFS